MFYTTVSQMFWGFVLLFASALWSRACESFPGQVSFAVSLQANRISLVERQFMFCFVFFPQQAKMCQKPLSVATDLWRLLLFTKNSSASIHQIHSVQPRFMAIITNMWRTSCIGLKTNHPLTSKTPNCTSCWTFFFFPNCSYCRMLVPQVAFVWNLSAAVDIWPSTAATLQS